MRRFIIFSLASFVAWGATAQIPTPLPFNPATAASSPVVAGKPSPAAPAPPAGGSVAASGLVNGYVPDDTYKLRAGDTVSFQILEDRIWNPVDVPKPIVVADSGELDVPYIGRVLVVDKTCKQAAEDIKATLEKDYYKKATVVLSLNTANRILGVVYISVSYTHLRAHETGRNLVCRL